MTPGLSVIIFADGCGAGLVRTLDTLARQRRPSDETLILVPRRLGSRHVDAARSFAASRGASVLVVDEPSSGAERNAAMRVTASELALFVEESDVFDPDFLERTATAMGADRFAAAGGPAIELRTSGRTVRRIVPAARDVAGALADLRRLPPDGIVRRDAWQRLGGFDESLPALDFHDFCLKALAAGEHVLAIGGPPMLREMRTGSRLRTQLDPKRHLPALRIVLDRYRAALESDPAAMLVERERLAAALLRGHRQLVARRDEAVKRRQTAAAEASELRGFLEGHGRHGIDWGELRRIAPVSRDWGYDRGIPVDRVFIERFLAEHADDIHGDVLEVQEDDLTKLFGAGRVARADVVDIEPSNPRATVIADLRRAPAIASASYDCILLTQTVHVIDDMGAVLAECRRILRPGGVLLATVPTASRVCLEYGESGDFWRMTEAGARSLFGGIFGADAIETRGYGNILTTAAFLYGMGSHEVSAGEYDAFDPFFPTLVGVRAVRPGGPAVHRQREATGADATILLYHRVSEDPVDVHTLAVPPEEFDAHMRVLAAEFAPLPLDELLARAAERRLPPRAVAVTFDDGYVDNLTEAGPILDRHAVPAAFFITSRPFDAGPCEFWWDQLERVFFGGGAVPARLTVDTGEGLLELATATRSEREHAHWTLHRRLVQSDRDTRERVMKSIAHWAGGPSESAGHRKRPMSRDELQELIATPRRLVGAHGIDHLFLPSQPQAARKAELEESRAAIARAIGREVRYFAYPYGGVDDEAAAGAGAAGYAAALTCEPRRVAPGDDPMRLPRVEVKTGAALRALLAAPPPSASARAPALPPRSGG